jgi:hypothetical protein
MKRIIKGKTFDTVSSVYIGKRVIGYWLGDTNCYERDIPKIERLYQRQKGKEYFILSADFQSVRLATSEDVASFQTAKEEEE